MLPPLTLILFAVLAFAALSYKSFVVVGKSEVAVVQRLDKFDRVLGEGVHMIIPFVEKIEGVDSETSNISLLPQVFDFPKDDRIFFANDKSQMKLKAQIVYQIIDPYKAVYEVPFLFDAINQLFASVLQKRLIEAPKNTDQPEYMKELTKILVGIANEYTLNWGVKILDFQLKQIIDGNGIRHNY